MKRLVGEWTLTLTVARQLYCLSTTNARTAAQDEACGTDQTSVAVTISRQKKLDVQIVPADEFSDFGWHDPSRVLRMKSLARDGDGRVASSRLKYSWGSYGGASLDLTQPGVAMTDLVLWPLLALPHR